MSACTCSTHLGAHLRLSEKALCRSIVDRLLPKLVAERTSSSPSGEGCVAFVDEPWGNLTMGSGISLETIPLTGESTRDGSSGV